MTWAPVYATKAELKERIGDTGGGTAHDAMLDRILDASSRAVDAHCGRQFGTATGARYYTARREDLPGAYGYPGRAWMLELDDLFDAPTLVDVDTVGDGTFAGVAGAAALELLPRNAIANGVPFTRARFLSSSAYLPTGVPDEVRVTAAWGWPAVPDAVVEATLAHAHRLYWGRNAPSGVAGSPELGSELRLLDRIHPDAASVLRPYVRSWGAR